MDWLKSLQKFILMLIIGLVWFDVLCFTAILVGTVMKWSFLSEGFSTGFFSAFGMSLGALLALAVLHVTLSLNLLSAAAQEMVRERAVDSGKKLSEEKGRRFARMFIGLSSLALILALGIMAYAELKVSRHKLQVTLNQLEATIRSDVAIRLAASIQVDAPLKEVIDLRDAMYSFLEERHGLSILIPRSQNRMTVYHEVVPWRTEWHDPEELVKSLSAAPFRVFVPYAEEKKRFEKLLRDHRPAYSFVGTTLRVYQPFLREGQIT